MFTLNASSDLQSSYLHRSVESRHILYSYKLIYRGIIIYSCRHLNHIKPFHHIMPLKSQHTPQTQTLVKHFL